MYKRTFYIKFASLKNALSFRSGTIYMNTINFFKGFNDDKGKGDISEGVLEIVKKEEVEEAIPGFELSAELKENIIGGIHLHSEDLRYYNIFSLYKLKVDFKEKICSFIHPNVVDLGDTYVLITDFEKFSNRIIKEININNYKYNTKNFCVGDVIYYSEPLANKNKNLGPFHKTSNYGWQNEFRFLSEPKIYNLDPLVINIGDISDITIIGSTSLLAKDIRFNFGKLKLEECL